MNLKNQVLAAIIATIAFGAGVVYGQCAVARPDSPVVPVEGQLCSTVPANGGTTGCKGTATAPNFLLLDGGIYKPAPASQFAIGNAKCATIAAMYLQAFSNDNGWTDGGTP